MTDAINQLGQALEITLAVFVLIVGAMIVYLLWLTIRLHQEVCRYCLRRPEVERDRDGRRIRERE